MIFWVTIIVVVVVIAFQQQLYKRNTKRFERKTRKRYDKIISELHKEKEQKEEDNS